MVPTTSGCCFGNLFASDLSDCQSVKEDKNPECVTPFLCIFISFGGEVHRAQEVLKFGDEDGVVGFFLTSRRSAADPEVSGRESVPTLPPSGLRLNVW